MLAMDRTTLTANVKPLERRGLLKILVDRKDRRIRRLALTEAGGDLLVKAVPIWRATHDDIDRLLDDQKGAALRKDLLALAFGAP